MQKKKRQKHKKYFISKEIKRVRHSRSLETSKLQTFRSEIQQNNNTMVNKKFICTFWVTSSSKRTGNPKNRARSVVFWWWWYLLSGVSMCINKVKRTLTLYEYLMEIRVWQIVAWKKTKNNVCVSMSESHSTEYIAIEMIIQQTHKRIRKAQHFHTIRCCCFLSKTNCNSFVVYGTIPNAYFDDAKSTNVTFEKHSYWFFVGSAFLFSS